MSAVTGWPDAAWRDLVGSALVVLVVVALAVFAGPRALSEPPDPTLTEATPAPDSYFRWFQAYLEVLPRRLGDYAMLLTPLAVGAPLVLLPLMAPTGERALLRRCRDSPPIAARSATRSYKALLAFLGVLESHAGRQRPTGEGRARRGQAGRAPALSCSSWPTSSITSRMSTGLLR